VNIEVNSCEKFRKDIGLQLHRFNREKCAYIKQNSTDTESKKEVINFAIYQDGKLIAGACGFIAYCWYYLDLLWVGQKHRKMGIGSMILAEIEKKARNKKCFGIHLGTWDFQAKEFYEKNGYKVYAELKDYPPGSTDFKLKKLLN